ncbi:nucleotidyltransferase family protein [Meiothermus ruber]|jgi:predicted nucleotidyltransferase|uniref:DNA polymerase beta domain protein region n=1 Tax=Meiothermus ruber (strain ATCC 35948 / DSM 1279 / VKM B-1258 / 21) TaxID=504728 RepID=D3PRC0_MEIRD|nr:nucleotidyltransferase family protein [Meiothermus ruber]ADD28003.1 DNA polymerase beta domain protein region [Meiothermus ruber DSM 1279]AGK04473.1 DNA polymerase beta domain-containing protein [Meiothermus ruber DSM 1279]MCL6530334.1 nucleotidyltransferase family protein [Meiothermus ruber]GAO74946.1 DNA polymerase beta domain-containing protein [Meiothermus ruber H328]
MTKLPLTRDAILTELRRLKPELARRYGVNRLALFGSFAQGEAQPGSDIDVVVELSEPDLFALVHIKEELESGFRRPVDVIPYSAFMNGFLKARIERGAIYV